MFGELLGEQSSLMLVAATLGFAQLAAKLEGTSLLLGVAETGDHVE